MDLKAPIRPFFLVNPNSATVKKRGSKLEHIAHDRDIPCVKSQTMSELDTIMGEAAKGGANWLAIEGGDGTVQATLSAYQRNKDLFVIPPSFTLLPGGMTNQVARQIGIKRPIETRLKEFLGNGMPDKTNMPMVHVEIPGSQDQYGFLFSSGAFPMATRYYFDNVHKDGKGGGGAVTKMIAKGFAGSKRQSIYHPSPLSLRITGDKEETILEQDHLTSIVTTLPGLMLGLDPFWADGEAPLRLTYVNADAKHLLRNLLSVWMGKKAKDRSGDGFESWRANVLKYEYDGPILLDGDPLTLPEKRLYVRATAPVEFWT